MNHPHVSSPAAVPAEPAAMSLHLRQQGIGIIAWACAKAVGSSAVVASAWVLPGESFLGLSYPQLRAVADVAADSKGT